MESSVNSLLFTPKSKDLVSRNDVNIILQSKYNRKCMSDSAENDIEDTWKKRLSSNSTLYNATKFRLDSLLDNNGTLTLNLGLTCYKDFQGTNLADTCLILQSQGLCDHDNSQAYLSDALGVGAFVQTADDHVVLLFRSRNVGEDKELWDRPGGHPEPKEIVGSLPLEEIDVSTLSPADVTKELFDSICNEVTSEVNIPLQYLEDPKILGIHRSNLNGGKPNVEFLVRCSLSSKEVESLYKEGSQSEAFESEQIRLIQIEQLLSAQSTNTKLWDKMAAGAKGIIILYSMYKHRFLI